MLGLGKFNNPFLTIIKLIFFLCSGKPAISPFVPCSTVQELLSTPCPFLISRLNNHLFVTFAQSGGEVPSGISLMIKDLERHEDFIDDKEIYRQYEHDFYKVEYAISQFNDLGLPDPKRFKVDFSEVEYPMTTQDKIMLNEYKLKHNLTTQAELLADENNNFEDNEISLIDILFILKRHQKKIIWSTLLTFTRSI